MNEIETRDVLRKAGLPDRARQVSVLMLMASLPGHAFSVEDIYRVLIKEDPAVNLSSLYRIARALRQAGLVECEPGNPGFGGGKHLFRCAPVAPGVMQAIA